MRYLLAAGCLGFSLIQSCAPSLRMVHEGNGYFEKCYAADFNPQRNDSERDACWNAWLAHYTHHQPAHRIDYAMRRVESLQAGEPQLGLPGLRPGAAPITVSSGNEAVTLKGPRAGAEAATRLQSGDEPRIEHGCSGMCAIYEARCLAPCPEPLGACADGCTHEKAICLGGCY